MEKKSLCWVRGYILSNYPSVLKHTDKKTWLIINLQGRGENHRLNGSNTYVEKNYKKVNFNVLRSFLTTKRHHTPLMNPSGMLNI